MNAGGRLNTCKSDGNALVAILVATSGGWVRTAYATCPLLEDNVVKTAIIFHVHAGGHPPVCKDSLIRDGHAYH